MKLVENKLLNEWILQQSEFSKNDLLVTINDSKIVPFSEIVSFEKLSKIISISQNSIKGSGTNPFCQTIGLLNWEWNQQVIQTPIWIVPCDFKLDKVRGNVELFPQEESGFVNPFLEKKLDEIYSVQLNGLDFHSTIEQLKTTGFEHVNSDSSVVGNFHHHRYILLKELHDLSESAVISTCLNQFLSGEKTNEKKLQLPDESLFPYDTDHQNIFQLFSEENCVVQGPPGTGKSQLLTNIVGKLLISDNSTVFVSEKRAALEVVKKRLSSVDLDQFSVIATDDLSVRHFIQDIKSTWKFLEDVELNGKNELYTRKAQENNLQFVLDILNQPELIGGISFTEFNKLMISVDDKKFTFLSCPPLLPTYRKTLSTVKKIYESGIDKISVLVPFSVFKDKKLTHLASTIEQVKDLTLFFEKIQSNFSQNDIEKLQYINVVYQLFENELAKKYSSVIEPNSKTQQQFLKLYQEYKKIQKQEIATNGGTTDWKIVPSELELDYLLQLTASKSIFQKLKFRKRWRRISNLPVHYAEKSIQELKERLFVLKQKITIEEKLTKIGVTNFSEIEALKASLHLFSKEKWELYHSIGKEERKLFSQSGATINLLKDELKTNFRLDKNIPILSQLEELLKQIPKLIVLESELQELNQVILDAVSVSKTIEDYQINILKTHQTIFQSHYPSLSAFEPTYLKDKIESLIDSGKKENELTAKKIIAKVKTKFDAYHKLLNTPATKLTEEEKALKQQLKKGKSILVKEFSKTRQHPTMREIVHSEAAIWIRLLKPVWLTNPTQLAKTFPLEKELFDVCIMDEASQIPVQNGIGALQRSKRVIIAGDEQQMNPTSFFQAGTKEVTSVLQHGSYYLPKATLTHHYRSKHAPLIAFSNRCFYDNQLVVYPSFPVDTQCITRHFCEKGTYIDRKNKEEAKKVVKLIENRLKSNKTIGVVAFSQEQVETIRKLIPSVLLEEIQNRTEQNTFFIKPLDKVQGDECENLIISLGYAPDEEENFHLRFGPLNTESGRNRLNVLFSRASESIDFVCSVESSALQWSENESIQLLYKWLKSIEQTAEEQSIIFPLNLTPKINGNQLIFKDIYSTLPNALELTTTYSVLKNRGWEILFA
jgi:superfamily I DNA and/or RNA helicase